MVMGKATTRSGMSNCFIAAARLPAFIFRCSRFPLRQYGRGVNCVQSQQNDKTRHCKEKASVRISLNFGY